MSHTQNRILPAHSSAPNREHTATASRRIFLGTCLGAAGLGLSQGVTRQVWASEPQSTQEWEARRKLFLQSWLGLLGKFPEEKCPLDSKMRKVAQHGGITRYHVSFQSEPSDRVTAYLLVPKTAQKKRNPAIICIHGTTCGTGKDRTIGLAGKHPDDPPDGPMVSRAYGLELARWGYVTLSIDLLCDGERVPKDLPIYDSHAFYRRHPHWSIVGKNSWDVMRSVDYLESLDLVDPRRIGCVGHSLGGHTTLFAAAFEPRLAASVCNGGVLSWCNRSPHWGRPEGFRTGAGPGQAYVYIKKFRQYIEDKNKPIPVDFDSLMMLTAPRPLLIMSTEGEMAEHGIIDKFASASELYRQLGAGDRLSVFSYRGGHGYPPVAKRHSFNWFDRWLNHTPAIPTIWPNVPI